MAALKPAKKTAKKTADTDRKLKWSIPGRATATVLYPSTDPNHVVIAQLIPGKEFSQARRGTIGDRPTIDDLIDIENFDLVLSNISDASKRTISVSLLHEKKKFKCYLAFSFLEAPSNPGDVFEIETKATGVTTFDILADL